MQILNHQQTLDALPYAALARSLRRTFVVLRRGELFSPVRSALPLPQGTLLYMPAHDGEVCAVKLVTVHPNNGLAANNGAAMQPHAVQADVLVMDARTGQRLALLDGEAVTARRTAALSAVAAQMLAANPAGPLLLVGAGTQACSHLEAFCSLLGTQRAYVYSRRSPQAMLLLAQKLGIILEWVTDIQAALALCPLVVTATTTAAPLFADQGVRPDAFFAAVGAFKSDMQELPPELVRRSRVVVDTLSGCRQEAGDLLQANINWDTVQDISLLTDPQPEPHRPTIFKSVGQAAWDLAAARLVLEAL